MIRTQIHKERLDNLLNRLPIGILCPPNLGQVVNFVWECLDAKIDESEDEEFGYMEFTFKDLALAILNKRRLSISSTWDIAIIHKNDLAHLLQFRGNQESSYNWFYMDCEYAYKAGIIAFTLGKESGYRYILGRIDEGESVIVGLEKNYQNSPLDQETGSPGSSSVKMEKELVL